MTNSARRERWAPVLGPLAETIDDDALDHLEAARRDIEERWPDLDADEARKRAMAVVLDSSG